MMWLTYFELSSKAVLSVPIHSLHSSPEIAHCNRRIAARDKLLKGIMYEGILDLSVTKTERIQ